MKKRKKLEEQIYILSVQNKKKIKYHDKFELSLSENKRKEEEKENEDSKYLNSLFTVPKG